MANTKHEFYLEPEDSDCEFVLLRRPHPGEGHPSEWVYTPINKNLTMDEVFNKLFDSELVEHYEDEEE